VINLGCIDLNQWYATCDDVDRPDYLHFDLDPGAGASFDRVLETALIVREALDVLKMPSVVKTTGSKGLHSMCRSFADPSKKQCGIRQGAGAGGSQRGIRRSSPPSTESQIGLAEGVGRLQPEPWGARWLDLLRPAAARRDSLDAGDVGEVEGGVRMETSPSRTCRRVVAKLGDLWAPLLRTRRAFQSRAYV